MSQREFLKVGGGSTYLIRPRLVAWFSLGPCLILIWPSLSIFRPLGTKASAYFHGCFNSSRKSFERWKKLHIFSPVVLSCLPVTSLAKLASSQTKCFPNLHSIPLKILSIFLCWPVQLPIRNKKIMSFLSYFLKNTRNAKTHSNMCKKAKFLFLKFRSLEPNTPDVHYHTYSTLLMYDKVPAKTICRFYYYHCTSFPRLTRKSVL